MPTFTIERIDYEEDVTGIVSAVNVVEVTTGPMGGEGRPGNQGVPGPNLVTDDTALGLLTHIADPAFILVGNAAGTNVAKLTPSGWGLSNLLATVPAGRVPFSDAGGLVTSNAGLVFNSGTGTLSAQNINPLSGNLRLGTGTSAGVQIGTGSIGTGSDAPVLLAGNNPFGFGLTVQRGDNIGPTDLYARKLFARDGLYVWDGTQYTFRNDFGRTRIGAAGVPTDDGSSSLQVAGAAVVTGNLTLGNGSENSPSINLGDPTTGFWRASAQSIGVTHQGVASNVFFGDQQRLRSTNRFGWASGSAVLTTIDTELTRVSPGFVGLGTPTNKVSVGHNGTNGLVESVAGTLVLKSGSVNMTVGQGGYAVHAQSLLTNDITQASFGRWQLNSVGNGQFLLGQSPLVWMSTAAFNGTADLRLRRSSANTADFDTGTDGAFADLRLRNLILNNPSLVAGSVVRSDSPVNFSIQNLGGGPMYFDSPNANPMYFRSAGYVVPFQIESTGVRATGNLTVRQPGGTAGTHEIQVSHNGTAGDILCPSGQLFIRPTGSGGKVCVGTASTGTIQAGVFESTGAEAGYHTTGVRLNQSTSVNWCPGTFWFGTIDLRLRRSSANTLDLDTGTDGAFADVRLRNLTATDGPLTVTRTSGNSHTIARWPTRYSGLTDANITSFGGGLFTGVTTLGVHTFPENTTVLRLGAGTGAFAFVGQDWAYPTIWTSENKIRSAGTAVQFRNHNDTGDQGITCGSLTASGTLTATNGFIANSGETIISTAGSQTARFIRVGSGAWLDSAAGSFLQLGLATGNQNALITGGNGNAFGRLGIVGGTTQIAASTTFATLPVPTAGRILELVNAGSVVTSVNTAGELSAAGIYFNNTGGSSDLNFNAAVPTAAGNNQLGIRYFSNNQMTLGFHSGARINFLGSGSQAQFLGTWNFPSGAFYPAPALAASGGGGNDVRLNVTKTGDGASQTVQLVTQRFSVNNDQPALRLVSNGFSVWTRGTLWNDGALARVFEISDNGNIHFNGGTPVARPTLPDAGTVTAADIRTALISLGLCQ